MTKKNSKPATEAEIELIIKQLSEEMFTLSEVNNIVLWVLGVNWLITILGGSFLWKYNC